jgi:hypothetical protein
VGQRFAVVAVTGVHDLDAFAAAAFDDLLTGDLVHDDDVGHREVVQGSDGHQPGVAGSGADEDDAGRRLGGLGRG